MSSKLQVSIPQAASWLLRLAAHPQLSDNLCRDAVAFSAWYAAANGLLDWPEEVESIQRTERAKKLSLDRVMKLLAQMNHTFSGRASAEQAKLLLEGYAVHDWVSDNSLVFRALASDEQETLRALDDISDQAREAISPFAARLHQLGRILCLSALEQEILAFAFLTTASQELAGIFEHLAENRWTAGILWTALFKTNTEELGKAMRPNSPLRLSGMLMAAGRRVQIARVSEFWIDLIAGGESVFDSLLEPFDNKIGSGRPARREGGAPRGKPLESRSRCGGRAGDQAQPKSIVARSDRKAQTLGDRVFPRLLEHRRALYTKRHLEVLEKAAARFGASLRAARHGQVPVHRALVPAARHPLDCQNCFGLDEQMGGG